MSPIIPVMKCPLWHLFLGSRSQSRITHFLCLPCFLSLLLENGFSASLWLLWKSHSWVPASCLWNVLQSGFSHYFSRLFFRVPQGTASCVIWLAAFSALRVAPARQEKPQLFPLLRAASQVLSGLRESAHQACDLSLQTLEGHIRGQAVSFEWNFIQSLRVTQA